MTLNLKRCISILLVLMLLIGIVPHAYAAEASETVAAATEPEETIDPTEPTEPTDPPNNLSTPAALSAANDYAVMSVASSLLGYPPLKSATLPSTLPPKAL